MIMMSLLLVIHWDVAVSACTIARSPISYISLIRYYLLPFGPLHMHIMSAATAHLTLLLPIPEATNPVGCCSIYCPPTDLLSAQIFCLRRSCVCADLVSAGIFACSTHSTSTSVSIFALSPFGFIAVTDDDDSVITVRDDDNGVAAVSDYDNVVAVTDDDDSVITVSDDDNAVATVSDYDNDVLVTDDDNSVITVSDGDNAVATVSDYDNDVAVTDDDNSVITVSDDDNAVATVIQI